MVDRLVVVQERVMDIMVKLSEPYLCTKDMILLEGVSTEFERFQEDSWKVHKKVRGYLESEIQNRSKFHKSQTDDIDDRGLAETSREDIDRLGNKTIGTNFKDKTFRR